MDTELEFPAIDADATAAASTAIAKASGTELATDITKVDLGTLIDACYTKANGDAKKAEETLKGLVLDLPNQAKVDDAIAMRNRLIKTPIAEVRKVTKAVKSSLDQGSKRAGANLDALVAKFEAADTLTTQIDAAQARIDEEKRIAAEKEEARKQAHRDALAKLAAPAERAALPEMTAERIANGITAVEKIVIDPAAWEEFAQRAEEQKAVTLERMRALHAKAVAAEAEAKRLEEERAEAARIAEAQRVEAERLAAERAEIERQRAELQAERDRIAAEAQARADEAARIEREQREEAERQARELQEAHARAEAAQAKHDAEVTRIANEAAKASAPGFKARKPLPDGVTAGACVNDSGQWYAADGTFMNPDGTRSIFDDVDEDSELEFAPTATNTPAQGSQQVLKAEASAPDATDRDAPASTSPSVGSMGAGQAADAAPQAEEDEVPMLKLGELWDALGLTDREAFLASIGFASTPAPKGTGKLYRHSDMKAICLAIAARFTDLAKAQPATA